MAKRASKLHYMGGKNGHAPGSYFNGIPAENLDADQIAALSDEDYEIATTPHPVYGALYAEDAKAKPPAEPLPGPAVLTPEESRAAAEAAAERGAIDDPVPAPDAAPAGPKG